MNSDYVFKGRGQLALQNPDWAKFTPASSSSATNRTPSPSYSDTTNSSAIVKPSSGNTAQADKTRMNEFTHSGSKKTVGPDVDNVDYSFSDFLDTINPLQQIPVVNMIYRELTGDKISGVAQVMGSALYWGPMGIVTGAVDAIFEQEKGGDMGETIMAGLLGTDTPNAKNLPSNKLKTAPDTMLADAGTVTPAPAEPAPATKVATAKTSPIIPPKTAAKQPFGGVMGNEAPAPVANVAEQAPEQDTTQIAATTAANDDTAPDANPLANTAPAGPAAHAPVQADGHKLYSLAGIIRHVGSPATMPPREVPDARLKSYGKPSYDKSSVPVVKPDPSKIDPSMMLGLQNPSASLANIGASASDDELPATRLPDPGLSAPLNMNKDSATPSGNPIPAQLIQDMMLMNMQKYQNDMKNGNLRGAGVDVNG